ncbi:MAG: VanZ family protein [Planctomycetota bacterium]
MRISARLLRAWSLLVPFSVMALLTYLSSLPGNPETDALLVFGVSVEMTPKWQNLLHVPAYTVLGLAWRSSLDQLGTSPMKGVILTLVFGISFGIVDELHQAFVPYRYPGVLDALLDALGIAIACLLWPWIRVLLPARMHANSPS